jgi:hypothetical protein
MDSIYVLNSIYNGAPFPGGAEATLRKYKGATEITYDLYDISEGDSEIIQIIADFNDGTALLRREYNNNDKNLIKLPIKHIFETHLNTHSVVYYPTLYITFSNFKKFIYQTPILIAKDSFYSKYSNLDIASCQFIDNSENSMFVTFDTQDGSILNLKIK